MDPNQAKKDVVLVVDDTPDNITLITQILKNECRIKAATGGQKALAIARSENPPDLILLDIMMPDMDGHEVCRQLKADPRTAEIPVIFLTARADVEDEKIGFSLGAVDYITKPISPTLVLARVKTQLLLKSAREYLKEKNVFLESTFSRYVSSRVLDQLKTTPLADFLRMERREVSILFSDMRGFTTVGAQLPPEQIQELVNSALEKMVNCVDVLDGNVNKFLGDGLMAIFGAPLRQEDHAWRAITAAVMMQKAHKSWIEERKAQNKPAISLGIGIATGIVVVGNIGTPSRMEYTVLGHIVNLASRLCHVAEGGGIITIPATWDQALNLDPGHRKALADMNCSSVSLGKKSFRHIDVPLEVLSVNYG